MARPRAQEPMRRTTLYLPERVWQAATVEADRRMWSVSAVITAVVTEALPGPVPATGDPVRPVPPAAVPRPRIRRCRRPPVPRPVRPFRTVPNPSEGYVERESIMADNARSIAAAADRLGPRHYARIADDHGVSLEAVRQLTIAIEAGAYTPDPQEAS